MSSVIEVPAQAPLDPSEYLRILRRRAWVIVAVTVLAVAAAYAWATNQEKTYTAVGQIVVAQTTEKGIVATQSQVVQSDTVHRAALGQLPNAPAVDATFDGESGSVTLRAVSTDPALAAKSIDAHIEAYKNYLTYIAGIRVGSVNNQITALRQQVNQLNAQARGQPSPTVTNEINSLTTQMRVLRDRLPELRVAQALAGPDVEVLRAGSPPTSSGTITTGHAMLIGLGVGLLLGVLAALLLELLDDSIRTQQDLVRVAGAEVPLLGTIPPTRWRDGKGKVEVLEQPASPAAEAYRSLRTAVLFAVADRVPCIAITSARTRDGKTETATNLAVSTAQLGERTVLVDCDLRSPHVHDLLGIPNDTGFTSLVSGYVRSLRPTEGNDRLFVLPSGPIPPKPAELLASPRSHEVLGELHADDALVIVDTPPLLLATDTVALAPALGGILLVATARVTRKKELRKALELLRQVDAPLLGLVLQSAASTETGGFGEERSRRERRQVDRWRKLNGAAQRAISDASPATPNGSAAAEPAHAIMWSAASGASPNGAGHTTEGADPPTGTTDDG